MKLQLSIDTENQQDLIDASLLLNYYLKPANKTAASESLKKKEEKVVAPTTKKKPSKVVEEEIEDEEPNFDEDGEEETEENEEEEYSEDEDGEEEAEEIEEEEYEEPVKASKKAPATKAPAKSSSSSLTLEKVLKACQDVHKTLDPKDKHKAKIQSKIQALIKKHGAKSTRTMDQKKWPLFVKDLKAITLK